MPLSISLNVITQAGNPDEAAYLGAHAWTRFLAIEGKSAVFEETRELLHYLGSIYKFTNDLKNAAKYYRRALELAPD